MKCSACGYTHCDNDTNDPFGIITICNIEGDNFNIFGIKDETSRSTTTNALYVCPRCGTIRVSNTVLWGIL